MFAACQLLFFGRCSPLESLCQLLVIHSALLEHLDFCCLQTEVYQEMGMGLSGGGEEASSILFCFLWHQYICTFWSLLADILCPFAKQVQRHLFF